MVLDLEMIFAYGTLIGILSRIGDMVGGYFYRSFVQSREERLRECDLVVVISDYIRQWRIRRVRTSLITTFSNPA